MSVNLDSGKTLEAIAESVKNGTFTPFLGAGAASLKPGKCDIHVLPWRRVARNLACICRSLSNGTATDNSRVSTSLALAYLRGFAREYLGLEEESWRSIVEGEVGRCNEHKETCGHLVRFQARLVELTQYLTTVFGRALAESRGPIRRLSDCHVELDAHTQQDVITFLGLLLDTLREELPVREGAGFPDDREEFRMAIGCKLLWASYELTTEETQKSPQFESLRQAHPCIWDCFPKEGRDETNRQHGILRLDLLEWLTNLLWYTLTYRIPSPPTSDELAFSLCLANYRLAPPRRLDLAEAAQLIENEETLAETMKKASGFWLSSWPAHNMVRNSEGLYTSIAAVMYALYSRYCVRRDAPSAEPAASAELSQTVEQHQYPLPLAFTTNLDCALESVFDRHMIDYHVVFPMRTRTDVIWLFRTYYRGDSSIMHWDRFMAAEDAFKGGQPVHKLVGPIIVKLHGSPSTKHPDTWEKCGRIKHHLVLTESAYLRSIVHEDKCPSWLTDQWDGAYGRYFLFMGYSLRDWNVRLAFYKSLHRGKEIKEHPFVFQDTGQICRWAIDRHDDPVRWKLLRPFGADICVGDLNAMPAIIRGALSIYDKQIPQVRAILGAI